MRLFRDFAEFCRPFAHDFLRQRFVPLAGIICTMHARVQMNLRKPREHTALHQFAGLRHRFAGDSLRHTCGPKWSPPNRISSRKLHGLRLHAQKRRNLRASVPYIPQTDSPDLNSTRSATCSLSRRLQYPRFHDVAIWRTYGIHTDGLPTVILFESPKESRVALVPSVRCLACIETVRLPGSPGSAS